MTDTKHSINVSFLSFLSKVSDLKSFYSTYVTGLLPGNVYRYLNMIKGKNNKQKITKGSLLQVVQDFYSLKCSTK